MKIEFNTYTLETAIPVESYLKKRKPAKFFNRETAAAVVCVGRLLKGETLNTDTSFYYAKGQVEYQDFGLEQIAAASRDDSGRFCRERFVTKAIAGISPLTQFKILYNMPLSFVAIEHHLTGDNAVIYASGSGLITQARHAPPGFPVLLGAGRVFPDGTVESGFALAEKEEFQNAPLPSSYVEAIDIFSYWLTLYGGNVK